MVKFSIFKLHSYLRHQRKYQYHKFVNDCRGEVLMREGIKKLVKKGREFKDQLPLHSVLGSELPLLSFLRDFIKELVDGKRYSECDPH